MSFGGGGFGGGGGGFGGGGFGGGGGRGGGGGGGFNGGGGGGGFNGGGGGFNGGGGGFNGGGGSFGGGGGGFGGGGNPSFPTFTNTNPPPNTNPPNPAPIPTKATPTTTTPATRAPIPTRSPVAPPPLQSPQPTPTSAGGGTGGQPNTGGGGDGGGGSGGGDNNNNGGNNGGVSNLGPASPTGGGGNNGINTAPNNDGGLTTAGGNTPGGTNGINTVAPTNVLTTTMNGQTYTYSLSILPNGSTVIVTQYPTIPPTQVASTADSERSHAPVGLIVGILFAGIFITIGAILAFIWARRRKRRANADERAVAFPGATEERHKERAPPFEEFANRPVSVNPAASIAGSEAPLIYPNEKSPRTRTPSTGESLRSHVPQSRDSHLSSHEQDIDAPYRPPRYASMYMGSEHSEDSLNFSPVRNVSGPSAPRTVETEEMYTPTADVWTAARRMEYMETRLQPNR